jgi:hypothetical protein
VVRKVPIPAIFASHPSLQPSPHSRSATDDHNGHVTASPTPQRQIRMMHMQLCTPRPLLTLTNCHSRQPAPHALHCGGCERCVNPHQLQPNRFNTLAVIFIASQVRTVPPTANAQRRRQNNTKLTATSPASLVAPPRNYCIRRNEDRQQIGFSFGYHSTVLCVCVCVWVGFIMVGVCVCVRGFNVWVL